MASLMPESAIHDRREMLKREPPNRYDADLKWSNASGGNWEAGQRLTHARARMGCYAREN